MKKRLLKIAKWALYPLFYLFCLGIFGYLSFPYDQLKNRVIAEFDRLQAKNTRRSRSRGEPMRLEIDELDSYWFTGVEVTGARLIIPPEEKKGSPFAARRTGFGSSSSDKKDDEPPKPSVLRIDHATARVELLPLLIGDVTISFAADAFGGTIEGYAPYGKGGGEVEVEFANVSLADISPLQQMLQGIPLSGLASGTLSLEPKDGKFAKADGALSARIDAVKLGGKRKNDEGKVEDVMELQGVALPSVQVGDLIIEATAQDGLLTLDDFGTKGRDFELFGDGKIKLHETWDRSKADVFLKFKFSDSYRTKSDAASSLLGKPGDKFEPAIEIAPRSPFKRAKTEDGFYRFHISGALGKIDFKPAGAKSPTGKRASPTRKPSPTRATPKRRSPVRSFRPTPRPVPKPTGDDEEEKDKEEEQEMAKPEPEPEAAPEPEPEGDGSEGDGAEGEEAEEAGEER
jgi:type II secretion system protein N